LLVLIKNGEKVTHIFLSSFIVKQGYEASRKLSKNVEIYLEFLKENFIMQEV
jgi:hypothetical protein